MAQTCACCDLEKPIMVGLHCHPDIVICSDCLDWLVTRRNHKERTAGPVRVVQHDPIFQVTDLARAKEHYANLGFSTDDHVETYAFAHRDGLTIHLARADELQAAGTLYLHVTDADQLADAWRQAGVEVDAPTDYEYGKREGRQVDPDGNLIRFGSPLPG